MELTPRARWALESVASERGRIFTGFNYLKTFRAAARTIIGDGRAEYLALRDLRHAAITELAAQTGNLAAVAAVAGHKDLRTTSCYFHADDEAASAALQARTEADIALEHGTEANSETVKETLPQKKAQGRVAQLDRALPSGGRSRGFESLRVRRVWSDLPSPARAGRLRLTEVDGDCPRE